MFDYGIGPKILPMKAYILYKLHEFYWVLKGLAINKKLLTHD